MEDLLEEYSRILASDFTLDFNYPTEEERKTMQILHRELLPETEKRLRSHDTSLEQLVRDLESRSLYPQDLDPATLARLERLLRHD